MIIIAGGGTGGHTSPGLAVAAALRARGIACEWIGSRTGLANRVAARVARRVAVTFAESADVFGGTATVVTGNPLRPELRTGRRAAALERFGFDPALPVVYVTGGAQGSHAINRAIGEVL